MVYPSRRSLVLLALFITSIIGGGLSGDAVAQFERATGPGTPSCPAGWALDSVRGECHRCEQGYVRMPVAPDFMGCVRPLTWVHSRPKKEAYGKGLLGTDCPAGQFLHWDRRCYSCPPGAIRTDKSIDSPMGCARPVPPAADPLQVRSACPPRAFYDIGRRDCWSCRPNWIRTAAPVDSETACTSELAGMLGVNPKAVCGDALRAVAAGEKLAGEARGIAEALVSPITKPLADGLRQVTSRVSTPAELDKLLADLMRPLRPYGAILADLPRVAEQFEKSADRLKSLILNPAFACNGDVSLLSRELKALDLIPRAQRAVSRLGDVPLAHLALHLAPRRWLMEELVTPEAQFPPRLSFVTVSVSVQAAPSALVGSLTGVTNLSDHNAVLGSLGAGLAAGPESTPAAVLTLLFFFNTDFDDLLGFSALGAEVNVSAGGAMRTALEKFWNELTSIPLAPPAVGTAPPLSRKYLPSSLTFSFDLVGLVTRGREFAVGFTWARKSEIPLKTIDVGGSFDHTWLLAGR